MQILRFHISKNLKKKKNILGSFGPKTHEQDFLKKYLSLSLVVLDDN